jgi:5-methyltetrahydrofolate--homocysteine methyltransferase
VGIDLHFGDADWERIERDWTAWWAGELPRPIVMLQSALHIASPMELGEEFLLERPIDALLDYYQQQMEGTRYYGDAFPKFWPNFGPGIVAGFLGADVHCDPDGQTVWFDHAPVEPRDLRFEHQPENRWWTRVRDLTRAAVERWGDRVAVAHTDLGGAVDILASFRSTQHLLYDLADRPEEVKRLVDEITPLWLGYYEELHSIIQRAGRGTTTWAAIWSPGRCYMFQCDFGYMISTQMFERFVMPDLSTCFEHMDHAFYHLDGKGQIRHLDVLLAEEELAGIQWIPGAGQPQPEGWLPLLARIRDAGKRCQLYVTADGARRIVRELGGRGFALYVINPMGPDDAQDFLSLLAAEDAGS